MMKISKERLVQLVLYKSRSAVKFSRVMLEIARSYIAELRGTNVMDLRCLLRVHERTATVHHLDSLRDATAVEVLMRWVETMRGRLKGSHAAQKLSERLESFGVETMVESGLLAELIEHSSKSHKETIQQKLLVSLLSSSSRSQVMQQVMRTGREVNKSHRKCEELVDKLARNGFTSSHRFTVSQLADPEDDAGRLAVTAVLFLVHPSLEYDKVTWMEDELQEMSSLCSSALESSSISESAEETVCETVIRKFIKLRQEHKQVVWSMLVFETLREKVEKLLEQLVEKTSWGIQSLEEINSEVRLRSERIMARLLNVEVNEKDFDMLTDKEEEERLNISHLTSKLHVFSILRTN
mmetsp:Transcript_37569/g.118575  ORF Transcript_37569/g.118575 Transcript_37569/m.118575 type:complete len:353 (-) Transcript_37569:1490-2548(-)